VAINSAPTEGVRVVPLSQIKATFPVLKNPANCHKAVRFTPEKWQSVQRSNAKHYKAPGLITEVKEYEGYAHLLPTQKGWEEIADYALEWAVEHAR
jgi:hypothetical protein